MADYDQEAPVYTHKRFLSKGGKYIDSTEKQLLAKHVRGNSLLEIGVADGRFIPAVRTMGWEYTGLDISERMLRRSLRHDCTLVNGDGENIPFGTGIFDSAICLHTFHFLPHPLQCIRETHRVLKKNGHLFLIFEMDTWLRRLVLKTSLFKSNQFYFTIKEVRNMMESNGFRVTAAGTVLKLPMEAYRKLPMTLVQRAIDSARHWPNMFATLGFVVGRKAAEEQPKRNVDASGSSLSL